MRLVLWRRKTLRNELLNPFVPNLPFLYHPKTSETHKIFWCFQGVEKVCIRNEWINVFSRGIQQASERSKHLDSAITNVKKKLKNQQERVIYVVQSIDSLKNQNRNINDKQAALENTSRQFSNERQELKSELKIEQQKNIIWPNKFTTFQCHLMSNQINVNVKS